MVYYILICPTGILCTPPLSPNWDRGHRNKNKKDLSPPPQKKNYCKDQVTRPTVRTELTIFPRVRLADLLYNYWQIFPVPGAVSW